MCKRLIFLSLISLFSAVLYVDAFLTVDKALWYGSIKFPHSLNNVPPVRIYYAGNKIPSEVDHEAHLVSFVLSEYKMKNTFYLIIVDQVDFVTESNTVQYLRVPAKRPYKLYMLTYKVDKSAPEQADINDKGSWEIVQKSLDDDLRIPDNAIIVCYHPHLIKSLEGGNALELPKLVFDSELLNQLSADEVHDASIQFLLSSLNSDSIHPKPESKIKHDLAHKTILSLQA